MPQLDRISLGTTIFWFIVSYFSLYFLIVKYILPNILKSLKYKVKKVKRFTEGRQSNQKRIVEQLISLKIEELKLNAVMIEKYLMFKTNMMKMNEIISITEENIYKEVY